MKKIVLLFVGISSLYECLAQNALYIPSAIYGKNFNLEIQNGSTSFFPNTVSSTIGINQNYLAPTLVLEQGDTVQMNVKNSLNDTTTLHWHGLHVPPTEDGGPHTYILSGNTWQPKFVVKDWAATYWYHPHLHHKTNEHVTKGAAGLIIVRDAVEQALALPRSYSIDDIPLILQTKAFNASKQIDINSFIDTTVLVNGTRNPYISLPAQVVRFRLLNASQERSMVIGFSDNSSFYQIASDAGLLTNSVQLSRLTLSPGERAEIVVNLSGRTGANVYMKSYGSELPNGVIGASMPFRNNPLNGANFNLLEIRVSAPTANPITTIPSQLSTHSIWAESAANATRSISMTGGFGNIFTLDNQSFDMMRIDHTVNLGHIEVWTLRNTTMMAHPFHIHGNSFYILDRNGVPPAANEQGRKDVVLVHGSEVVRFITKFEDYADSNTPYMYHCHMLPHEDSGMMGQFLVVQNIAVYNAEKQHSAIKLYPNPNNTDLLRINCDEVHDPILQIMVQDIWGRKINTYIPKNKPHYHSSLLHDIDISGLSKGVYLVTVFTQKEIITSKLIKE